YLFAAVLLGASSRLPHQIHDPLRRTRKRSSLHILRIGFVRRWPGFHRRLESRKCLLGAWSCRLHCSKTRSLTSCSAVGRRRTPCTTRTARGPSAATA